MSEDEPVFGPEDHVRYSARLRGVDKEYFRIPSRLILLYQNRAFEYVKQALNGKALDWLYGESRPFYIAVVDGKEIGAFRAWIGAPAASAMLEELIFCGAEKVIEVGTAGGLESSSQPGDIMVVTEAFRDEGTSSHYFGPDVRLRSSQKLRELLIQRLDLKGIGHLVGPVWTTDGVYRETRGKLLKYRGRGAIAVNMETSALFAVARYRNVEIASVQVISDVLSEERWQPAFQDERVSGSMQSLLNIVIEALSQA